MRRHVLIGLVIGLVTFAVFSSGLKAGFVQWDDDINIYANPHHGGLQWSRIVWMFTDVQYVRYYAPLSWLGLSVIYEFSGLKPLGYHLAGLLLHCLNAGLVYLLLRQLLQRALSPPRNPPPGRAIAWACAAGTFVWAAHPMRVEVVTWATGFSYNLALLFLLISALCHARRGEAESSAKIQTGLYAISFLAFVASLLSYPIGLGYPLALIIWDLYLAGPGRRGAGGAPRPMGPRQWLEKVPFLLVSAIILGFTIYRRMKVDSFWALPEGLDRFGVPERFMQAVYIWAYYVWRPWVPVHLSPVYPTLVWFKPSDWPFVLSLLGVVAGTILLIYKRRQWPAALALWGCHLALLVPLLGLTEHPHYPNDRYNHISQILWSIVIAAVVVKGWTAAKPRWGRQWALAGAMGVLAFLTVQQIQVWRNSEVFFRYILARLGPHWYACDIHWRLGIVLAEQRRTAEAISHFSEAVRIMPHFVDARQSLAAALESQGRTEAALEHYLAAARFKPDAGVHGKIALLLAGLGRPQEASVHYREALRLKPDWPEALNNFAWLLATAPEGSLRNGTEAVQLAQRACELTGNNRPMMVGTLAAAYAEAGRFPEAMATAQKAHDLAQAAGETELAATNLKLLELYRQGRPYRADPPSAEGRTP